MTSLSYGSNVGSLLAQTNLRKTTDALSTSFERLSSGLRINTAKDDPAGYALANDLNVKARTFTQAIRNANDGISMVNVAEASANELTSLLSRLSELATQASNGSLTRIQRLALDDEAQELTEEYNRIVSNTEFNAQALLDGSLGSVSLQVSDDSQNNIEFELGEELGLTVGDGTFQDALTGTVSSFTISITTGDFNGDGRIDLAAANAFDAVHIHFGNGDGTFAAAVSYGNGDSPVSIRTGDLDGDGDLDIVTHSTVDDNVNVLLNAGDGTFSAYVSYDVVAAGGQVNLGDFDGDGDLDVVSNDNTNEELHVLLNNGDGTFGSVVTTSVGSVSFVDNAVGDVNGDGITDLVINETDTESIFIALGNGDGTFQSYGTIGVGTDPSSVLLEDMNHDGILDIISTSFTSNSLEILLGNGDGTFASGISYLASSDPGAIRAGDLNGDGHTDIAVFTTSPDEIEIFYGSGTGTLTKSNDTYSVAASTTSSTLLEIADLNGDNVLDIVNAAYTGTDLTALLGNTREIQELPRLDLTRTESALASLELIERVQDNVTLELGNIGAISGRLDFTTSVLTNIRDEYLTAESRIIDADVASEVAEMVRLQVLQQAGAAVLAQANASPQVALTLLASSN